MTDKYDVVVAGGGLVGTAFAALLASSAEAQGLRIGLIERQPNKTAERAERFDPRVVALAETSRKMLAEAGIWNEQVEKKASPYGHMEVRDGEGTGLIEFDCHDVHQTNLGHIVENPVIIEAAVAKLDTLSNVEFIYCGIEKVNLSAESPGVSLVLNNNTEVSTHLLVAADGANSLVREQCGFKLRSWDYGHSAIVTTIETAKPHNRTAFQWFTPQGPLAFLPLETEEGDCHYCSIVWSQEHDVATDLMALTDEAFCQALNRTSELRLGEVIGVSRRFSIPLRQRHATGYVKPGVVLLGDAAHTIHPLAGQGVNLGFADVRALVDEIVRGLQRGLPVGHLSTLERYQRRRKPDNLAMMAAMEALKGLFANRDPLLQVLRNSGMSRLNSLSPLKNRLVRQAMGF